MAKLVSTYRSNHKRNSWNGNFGLLLGEIGSFIGASNHDTGNHPNNSNKYGGGQFFRGENLHMDALLRGCAYTRKLYNHFLQRLPGGKNEIKDVKRLIKL